jgi:hypothetical protein
MELELIAKAAEGRFRRERYRYRGHEFEIERSRFTWWCHGGIRIPERPPVGPGPHPIFESYNGFMAAGLAHEAGWASQSRRSILRKLRRAIHKEIRDDLADEKLEAGSAFSAGP